MPASKRAQLVLDEEFTLVRHQAKGAPVLEPDEYLLSTWLPIYGPSAVMVFRILAEHVDPCGAVKINRAGLMARCGLLTEQRLFSALYRLSMFFPHPIYKISPTILALDPVVRAISPGRSAKLATFPPVAA